MRGRGRSIGGSRGKGGCRIFDTSLPVLASIKSIAISQKWGMAYEILGEDKLRNVLWVFLIDKVSH